MSRPLNATSNFRVIEVSSLVNEAFDFVDRIVSSPILRLLERAALQVKRFRHLIPQPDSSTAACVKLYIPLPSLPSFPGFCDGISSLVLLSWYLPSHVSIAFILFFGFPRSMTFGVAVFWYYCHALGDRLLLPHECFGLKYQVQYTRLSVHSLISDEVPQLSLWIPLPSLPFFPRFLRQDVVLGLASLVPL